MEGYKTLSKAEMMRKWRQEKEEKRKATRAANYQKHREELVKKATERKRQAGGKVSHVKTRQMEEPGPSKNALRVRKHRQ